MKNKKSQKQEEYFKKPEAAWEARRTYLEYNGIRDSRAGWTRRLGLSPNGFGNRLALYKKGKMTLDQLFRPGEDDPKKRIHTKYELKMPRKEFLKMRKKVNNEMWVGRERCPKNHTIRVWETVFQALQKIKPDNKSWSQFFIEHLKLAIKIPDAAKYKNS